MNTGPVPLDDAGEAVSRVRAPVGPIENSEMLLGPLLSTYRFVPEGLTVTSTGIVLVAAVLVAKGDPGIWVRAPVGVIAKTDTVLVEALVTNIKCSAESMVKEEGDMPTVKGDPATGWRVPAP